MVSRNLRVLSAFVAMATTFACAQSEKKKDETKPATTNTPTNTGTSTSGDATGTKTTTTTSGTGTSTATTTSNAKKLVGNFLLNVNGQFFGKAFSKSNFAYTFKDGSTDFPILPDNIKSISGVKTITYTVSGSKINVSLNRDSGVITVVMSLTWTSDDAFKASKLSCDAGSDLIGGVACSQLTQLDITGKRQATTTSTGTSTDDTTE